MLQVGGCSRNLTATWLVHPTLPPPNPGIQPGPLSKPGAITSLFYSPDCPSVFHIVSLYRKAYVFFCPVSLIFLSPYLPKNKTNKPSKQTDTVANNVVFSGNNKQEFVLMESPIDPWIITICFLGADKFKINLNPLNIKDENSGKC